MDRYCMTIRNRRSKYIPPKVNDRAWILWTMFAVFFIVIFGLVGRAFSQDLVLLDSITVPVVETYDTLCDCYPDSMVVYSWLDESAVNDTLALQFGYTRLGRAVWTTTILVIDSEDSAWSLNPFIMHHLDPYDVNRDGKVSITDAYLLIRRLFF